MNKNHSYQKKNISFRSRSKIITKSLNHISSRNNKLLQKLCATTPKIKKNIEQLENNNIPQIYTIYNQCNNKKNIATGCGVITLTTLEIIVGGIPYNDIINFPWIVAQMDMAMPNGLLLFYAELTNGSSLTVSVFNGTTNTNIGTLTINSSGFYTIPFVKPTTNCVLNVHLDGSGGTPVVRGIAMKV